MLEIYEEISNATVKNVVKPKILNSSQNEIIDQYLDSSKAKKILGWQSKINLQVGLEKTVAWYREYFNERD